MASNFAFLHEKFPELEELGMLAERYMRSDPQSCLMKAGLLCEGMIRVMFALDDITLPERCDAVERIDILQRREALPADVAAAFHLMHKVRNKAAHEGLKISEAKTLAFLQITHSLCGWFFQTYVMNLGGNRILSLLRMSKWPGRLHPKQKEKPDRKTPLRIRPFPVPRRHLPCRKTSAASALQWPPTSVMCLKPKPGISLTNNSEKWAGRPIPKPCAIPSAHGRKPDGTWP